jgi:hypothetical protein
MGVSLRGLALFLTAAAFVGCNSSTATPKQAAGSATKVDKQDPKDTPPKKKETQEQKATEPAITNDVFLRLPRFPTGVDNADAQKALEGVPTAKCIYVGGSPGYIGISVRYDTARVDVGDIAKALTALGGDKSRAVAVLSLSRLIEISEAQFAALKKELVNAKGIDWKRSDRQGIALDEAGGAKYAEIEAGYRKAGITLQGD